MNKKMKPKREDGEDTIYVQFDNGKKMSAKDIADLCVTLRKTASKADMLRILSLEYKFTEMDMMRFKFILKALADNWDLLGALGDDIKE
jgi:hypothetical protein